MSEFIEGADLVDAFAYEKEAAARFAELDGNFCKASVKATFVAKSHQPCYAFCKRRRFAGVGTCRGAHARNERRHPLMVFKLCKPVYKPFNEISGVLAELQNAAACAARVFELLDAEDEPADLADGAVLVPDGSVQFENVSFSYTPEVKLIHDFSLDIPPGTHVAIVGPTGSGKTTLINLLMRFYDVSSGAIKISGQDIRHVTRESLRRAFGMVLQDTWLAPGTIRENIAYGNPNATDEEIPRSRGCSTCRELYSQAAQRL